MSPCPPYLPHHVALLYDERDAGWLGEVYRGLSGQCRRTWSMAHELRPSCMPCVEVRQAVDHARVIVVVVSGDLSPMLKDALDYANSRVCEFPQQRLVLVLLDGAERPTGSRRLKAIRLPAPAPSALVDTLCAIEAGSATAFDLDSGEAQIPPSGHGVPRATAKPVGRRRPAPSVKAPPRAMNGIVRFLLAMIAVVVITAAITYYAPRLAGRPGPGDVEPQRLRYQGAMLSTASAPTGSLGRFEGPERVGISWSGPRRDGRSRVHSPYEQPHCPPEPRRLPVW